MMATDTSVLEQFALRSETPRYVRVLRALARFVRNKPLGAFGALIVGTLLLMAFVPGLFATWDPNQNNFPERLEGTSADHWFGTDRLGRDQWSRIVYGARTSIIIGFLVIAVSATIATVVGVTSGYVGGWFDSIAQRLVDIGLAMPGLIFIILVVTSLQQFPPGFLGLAPDEKVIGRIALSVGMLISLGSSRIIRGSAIAAKQNQYVEAARVVGASDLRIIWRHVFPNVAAIIIVSASIQIGGAILIESSLSFLGYGVQPPTASWGRMLNDSREDLTRHVHLALYPGLAIFFAVYSFNMFGDALRDVLDPRLRTG